MNEKHKELFGELPAEIQEELRRASTQEEILAILEKHAIPLPDEVLEAVAGGFDWESAMYGAYE